MMALLADRRRRLCPTSTAPTARHDAAGTESRASRTASAPSDQGHRRVRRHAHELGAAWRVAEVARGEAEDQASGWLTWPAPERRSNAKLALSVTRTRQRRKRRWPKRRVPKLSASGAGPSGSTDSERPRAGPSSERPSVECAAVRPVSGSWADKDGGQHGRTREALPPEPSLSRRNLPVNMDERAAASFLALDGILVLPEPCLDLLEVLGRVVDHDADQARIDAQALRRPRHGPVAACFDRPDGSDVLVHIRTTGEASTPPTRPGAIDDPGMLDGGKTPLQEPAHQGRHVRGGAAIRAEGFRGSFARSR